MNHWMNEGKEYLKKDRKFDHQGKSEEQVKASAIGCFIGGIGMVIIFIFLLMKSLM